MKYLKFISPLILLSALSMAVSCGKSDSQKSNAMTKESFEQEDDQGVYRAVLRPINESVAGNTIGTVEIKIVGDDVVVESNVTGSPAGVKHLQNIMRGHTCPGPLSDKNSDGVIDVVEMMGSTGQFLIPLDSDISTQLDGISFGPIANSSGTYVYRRSTTLSHLLSDLASPDPDPTDSIIKLSPGQNLNLRGRVVIIHGARPSLVPQTAAGLGEQSSSTMLPIACGELVRITDESFL